MGWLIFIALIVFCALFTIFGIRLCLALANMFGIDRENIPKRTYAPNGIYIGSLLGLLIMLLTKSAIVGLIAGIGIGLVFFIIFFFIEIAITKATRPLENKIEEKLTDAFGKPKAVSKSTGEETPLERIAREENAKEQAANERKLLESGGWRCAKCGKVNVSSIGFCSCGISRGESKKMDEERKKQREEMQAAAQNSAASAAQNSAASAAQNSAASAAQNSAASAANTGAIPAVNIAEYDLSVLDEEIEGNKWKCLKCQTLNPKLVTACKCGNTYQKNSRIMDALKAYKEQQINAAKEEAERQKAALANEQAELDHQIVSLLQNAGIDNPGMEQKTAVKLLKMSKERMTMAEICHKLPRSADIKAYQKTVEELVSLGVIDTDENQKYGIKQD